MRTTALAAFILLAWVRIASADVVTLTDATTFPAIAVENVTLVPGKTTLLARELQGTAPVGEARPLDAARVRRIEYRAAGDTDPRPRGRGAAMIMVSGKRFESVWIESCDRTPTGSFIFQIRESFVAPGGVAFAVDSSQIASIAFRPYAVSGSPMPAPGAPGAVAMNASAGGAGALPIAPAAVTGGAGAPPITGPAGAAPTIVTGHAAAPGFPSGPGVPGGPAMAMPPGAPAPAGVAVASAPSFPTMGPGAGEIPVSPGPAGSEANAVPPGMSLPDGVAATPTIQPVSLNIGEITDKDLNRYVTVVGQITRIRPSWSTRAPQITTLTRDGKTIDFVCWDDVRKALGDRMDAFDTVGTVVQVTGYIEDYRGNVQIRVVSAEGMRVADVQPTPIPPIVRFPAQIAETDNGRVFILQGIVGSITPPDGPEAPTKILVTDSQGGKVTVVFWNDPEGKSVGFYPPEVGRPWEVEGKVQVIRGDVQLRAKVNKVQ